MRRLFISLSILLIPMLMGMGTGSGGPTHKIPSPDKNYTATIVDSEGVTTKVNQISIDGKTYLAGSRGNTTVTVPFEKIASIQVGKLEEDKKVAVFVTLKAGGTLNMKVEGKVLCYGSADFGNVQIELKDIKKVDIHALVPKENP